MNGSKSVNRLKEDEEIYANRERVYDKLYSDKDKYFSKKKLVVDSKLEKEIEQCTFSPSTSKKRKN